MEKKILFIDTETGGIDPNSTSLLSIGLVAWSNGEILDEKIDKFLDETLYIVTHIIMSLDSYTNILSKQAALICFSFSKRMV